MLLNCVVNNLGHKLNKHIAPSKGKETRKCLPYASKLPIIAQQKRKGACSVQQDFLIPQFTVPASQASQTRGTIMPVRIGCQH